MGPELSLGWDQHAWWRDTTLYGGAVTHPPLPVGQRSPDQLSVWTRACPKTALGGLRMPGPVSAPSSKQQLAQEGHGGGGRAACRRPCEPPSAPLPALGRWGLGAQGQLQDWWVWAGKPQSAHFPVVTRSQVTREEPPASSWRTHTNGPPHPQWEAPAPQSRPWCCPS